MAALDNFRHLTIEEGQQQRTDVRAVDVGIGHDDNAVVAQLIRVVLIPANAAAQRGDQGRDSCEESILSKRAFSTLRIFPFSGRMA